MVIGLSYFLPLIADYVMPETESGKLVKEQRQISAQLTRNGAELNFNKEELSIATRLKDHGIISTEDYTQWSDAINRNNAFINQSNSYLKNSLLDNLEKRKDLADIFKNDKNT